MPVSATEKRIRAHDSQHFAAGMGVSHQQRAMCKMCPKTLWHIPFFFRRTVKCLGKHLPAIAIKDQHEINSQTRKPLIGELAGRKVRLLALEEFTGIVPGGVITGGVVECREIVGQNCGSASEVLARVIRFERRKTAHHRNPRHRVQDRDQAYQLERDAAAFLRAISLLAQPLCLARFASGTQIK